MVKSQVITLESAFLREIMAGLVAPLDPPLTANGSAASNVTGAGARAWSNPGNALVAGDDAATVENMGGLNSSNWLRVQGWQLAAIPANAAIAGLRFDLDAVASSNVYVITAWLLREGELIGEDFAVDFSPAPITTGRRLYSAGGPNALFGATFTRAQLLHPDTGVQIRVNGGSGSSASVFHLSIAAWWE
jgi:hypothetical protein